MVSPTCTEQVQCRQYSVDPHMRNMLLLMPVRIPCAECSACRNEQLQVRHVDYTGTNGNRLLSRRSARQTVGRKWHRWSSLVASLEGSPNSSQVASGVMCRIPSTINANVHVIQVSVAVQTAASSALGSGSHLLVQSDTAGVAALASISAIDIERIGSSTVFYS